MSKVYSQRREPWLDDPILFFPTIDDFKPQLLKNIRQLCNVDQLASFAFKTPISVNGANDQAKDVAINSRRSASKRQENESNVIQLSLAKAKQAISHISDTSNVRCASRALTDNEIIDLIWLEIMGGEDARYHLRTPSNPNVNSNNSGDESVPKSNQQPPSSDKNADFSFYETVTREHIVSALSSGIPFALALRHFDHITTTKSELYLNVINHSPRNDTERYVNWEKCMKVLSLLPTFNIDLIFRGRELASGKNADLLFDILHEFHRASVGTGLVLTHTCLELALLDELYKASMATPLDLKQLNKLYASGRLMASANLPQKALAMPSQSSTRSTHGTPTRADSRRQSTGSPNPVYRSSVSISEMKGMLTPSTPSKKDFHKANRSHIAALSENNKERRELEREQLLQRVSNTAYSSILSNPSTPRSRRSSSVQPPNSSSVKGLVSTPRSTKHAVDTSVKLAVRSIKPGDLPPTIRKSMSPSALQRMERTGVVTYGSLLEVFKADKNQLHSFLTAFTEATNCSLDSLGNDSLNSIDASFTVGCLNQSSTFTASTATGRDNITLTDVATFKKHFRRILLDVVSFDSAKHALTPQEAASKVALHESFFNSITKEIESKALRERVAQIIAHLKVWTENILVYNITKQNYLIKAKFLIENWLRENGCVPPSEILIESPINDPYRNGIAIIQIHNLIYHRDEFFRSLQMRLSLTDDLYSCYLSVSRVTTKQSSESLKVRSATLNTSLSVASGNGDVGNSRSLRDSTGSAVADLKGLLNQKTGMLFPKYQTPTNINDCIRNNAMLLRKLMSAEGLPSCLVPNANDVVQGDFNSLYTLLLLFYIFDRIERAYESRNVKEGKEDKEKKISRAISVDDLCITEFIEILSELVDLYSPKTDQLLQAQRGPNPIPRTKDELSKLNGICYSILLYANGIGNLFPSASRIRSVQVPQALTPSRRASSIGSLQKSISLVSSTGRGQGRGQSGILDDIAEDDKEVISYFQALEAAHAADYAERKEQYAKLENAMSNWLYSLDCLPEPYMKMVDISYFLRDGVALCKIVSTIFKLNLTPVDPNPKSANIQLANIKRALRFARETYQYRSVPIPFIDSFEETAISIQRAEVGSLLILMRELYRIFAILRRETGIGGRASVSIGMSPSGVAYKLKASRRSPSPTASRSVSPSAAHRASYSKDIGQMTSRMIKLAYAIDDIDTYADSKAQKADESIYISDCLIRAPEEMQVWKIPSTAHPLISMQTTMIHLPFSVQGAEFVTLPVQAITGADVEVDNTIIATASLQK